MPGFGVPFRLRRSLPWLGGGLLLATVIGFAGKATWWLDLFSHFRIQYVLLGCLVVLVSLVVRQWVAMSIGLVVVAVNLLIAGPVTIPTMLSAASAGLPADIKVMTANLNHHDTDVHAVSRAIDAERPGVIALQEVLPEAYDFLSRQATDYPYREFQPCWDRYGVALFSRVPWVGVRTRRDEETGLALVEAGFETAKGPLTVIGTHLWRPGSGERDVS